MKNETKLFLFNAIIVLLSVLTIIIVKLLYYWDPNKIDVYLNSDIVFLCASSLAGMTANRELNKLANNAMNIILSTFSIIFCGVCIAFYGVGVISAISGYPWYVLGLVVFFVILYFFECQGLLKNSIETKEILDFSYSDKEI